MSERTLDDLRISARDPQGLRDVLARLVAGARDALGDEFVGAWLQGSLATGDFEDLSDVDFIVGVREDVPDDRVATLQALHRTIFDQPSHWARHLEGSYAPLDALASTPPPRRKLVYIDHGATSFEHSDHDHCLVVLWILRERGITLAGPPARALIPRILPDALAAEVRGKMRDWGTRLFAAPDNSVQRWLESFAILSYCRMRHTLVTGEVRSKRAGLNWARESFDRRWRGLIDRAWESRVRTTEESHRSADPQRLAEMRAFIRYVLGTLDRAP